jgi:DNA-binding CsgD family transcriptional regulator/PAS domain-containing protein
MAKVTIDAVSSLVGQIYEAAYDQERWQDVINGFHRLFDGSRACIVKQSPDYQSAVVSVADDALLSPEAVVAYFSEPMTTAFWAAPAGRVFRRSDLADESVFRRGELWHDWFQPRDMYGGLSCKLHSLKDVGWFIDVQRGKKQPEFSESEEALFGSLMPHVQRAGQIGEQFETKVALAAAFSYLPFGVLVVDGHRRILQMNDAAEALLARPDSPLRSVGRVVATAAAKDTQMLERLVVDSCAPAADAIVGMGGSMMVPSDPAQLHLARFVLSISPFLNARVFGLEAERCAVILTRDVSLANSVGFGKQLRSLFALTAAEAKIASSLAAGLTLKQAAEESSIRITTARSYLEKIFRKTGTNQQSQLVALLKSVQPLRLK